MATELISGNYYRDDAKGVYKYSPLGIQIVAYPPKPSINGTWVPFGDPRYTGMVASLKENGNLITEAEANAAAASTPSPAPTPTYQPSPQSYAPPVASPSSGLPSSPAPSPASGGSTTPIYLESWFPWVVGGSVLTIAAGLAIVFWPTAKPAET